MTEFRELRYTLDYANQYLSDGGHLYFVHDDLKSKLSQQAVNQLVKQGEIMGLPKSKLKAAPAECWDEYVKIGGEIAPVVNLSISVSKDAWCERLMLGKDISNCPPRVISFLQTLTPDYWQYYISNGGDLNIFLDPRFKKVNGILPEMPESVWMNAIASQRSHSTKLYFPRQILEIVPYSVLEKYVASGGYLNDLTDKQRRDLDFVDSASWEKRVEDCLSLTDCPNNIFIDIPQKSWNIRAANFGYMQECPKAMREVAYENAKKTETENLQKLCSRVASGEPLDLYTFSALANVPIEYYDQRVATGYSTRFIPDPALSKISPEITNLTAKAKEAIILFDQGLVRSDELPIDVFVNNYARLELLRIAEKECLKRFYKICEEQGFDEEDIPYELYSQLTETLNAILKNIEARTQESLKQIRVDFDSKKAKANMSKATKTDAAIAAIKRLGDNW